MLAFFACFAICLTSASSHTEVVCRESDTERVTCPEDFHCCGVDQCCQLTFSDLSDKARLADWSWTSHLTGLGLRTLIVCVFMGALYIVGRSIQVCRRRYLVKYCSDETSLPRYKPLDKNSIASDIDSISAIIGTPLYSVNTLRMESFKVSVPI